MDCNLVFILLRSMIFYSAQFGCKTMTLLIFAYFLIPCNGESTLNSCIRSTL